jgi:imidazolonepropionase-like amidohydrolase
VLFGTIIDGTGAAPIEDAAVIIQDGVIAAVGSRQEIEIPPEAVIFELPDSTILPGFINAHVHTTYNPFLLKQWAQDGVTTVRDLGARYPFSLFSTRDRYNQDPDLATLIAAGPLITVPRGYPIAGNNFPSLVVTHPDHARREVAELIREGADVIKIVVDSGEGWPTLPLDRASAIVETAHQWDVPVAAHIGTLDDLRLALDAGIDDFSHVVPALSEDLLEQLVENRVYWVPTLETAGGYDAGNVLRLIQAGGWIALGNDGGMLPGIEVGMPMREIEMLQTAGMTPMEIIVAATLNAAHVCNREDTLGTLEVGKIADVLVIQGDPLVDLQALKDVLLVIHQGVIIRESIQP